MSEQGDPELINVEHLLAPMKLCEFRNWAREAQHYVQRTGRDLREGSVDFSDLWDGEVPLLHYFWLSFERAIPFALRLSLDDYKSLIQNSTPVETLEQVSAFRQAIQLCQSVLLNRQTMTATGYADYLKNHFPPLVL